MKIARTFVAATFLVIGGCGKKETANQSESTTVKATEEATEEEAETDETIPTVELPTLDLTGAIAVALRNDGPNLNLTGADSNLRKINADGTDSSALSETSLITQEVIVGPNDQIYVVFKAEEPEETAPRDYTTVGPNDAPEPEVATVAKLLGGEKAGGEIRKYAQAPFLAWADIANGTLRWVNSAIVVPFAKSGYGSAQLQFDEKGGVYYQAGVDSTGKISIVMTTAEGISSTLIAPNDQGTNLGEFKVGDSSTMYYQDGLLGSGAVFQKINPTTKETKTIAGMQFPIAIAPDGKVYSAGNQLNVYDPATDLVTTLDVAAILCPDGCPNPINDFKDVTSYGNKVLAKVNGRLTQVAPTIAEIANSDGFSVAVVISDTKIVLVSELNEKLFLRDDTTGTTTELILGHPMPTTPTKIVYLAGTNELVFNEGNTVNGVHSYALGRYNLTTGVSTYTATSEYSNIQSLSK